MGGGREGWGEAGEKGGREGEEGREGERDDEEGKEKDSNLPQEGSCCAVLC